MGKLRHKDLISIHDLSPLEIKDIFDLAAKLKKMQKDNEKHEYLWAKSLAMIFEKPSTRTRVSFEIGMWQLGGLAINLDQEAIGLGVRESIGDVAKTLSRFADALLVRTFEHNTVIELAKYSTVPVINGLSDLLHPCQALADLFTIQESKGKLKGLKLSYIGDGNNVCHSLMLAAAKTGLNMTVACPKGYEPKEKIAKLAFSDAKKSGAEINILNDPIVAVKDADVVYTDVWASMGQEKQKAQRAKIFQKYQVNKQLMKLPKPDAIVMHCLPAHRGEEVSAEVIDGPQSAVWEQAENRLYSQKALLEFLLT